MSAPTYGLLLDLDKNELAYGFCNVGWWSDDELIIRCCDDVLESAFDGPPSDENKRGFQVDFKWDPDWRSKWAYLKVYGTTFTREFLAEGFEDRMEKAGRIIE